MAVEMLKWRTRLSRRIAVQRRMVRKMPHFNYGAVRGIRSTLAAKQREQLFTYEDEDTYLQALRTRILSTVSKTVEAHGIDASDLESQQKTIINKTYRIGDVQGHNVVIGDSTTFNAGLPGLAADDEDMDE